MSNGSEYFVNVLKPEFNKPVNLAWSYKDPSNLETVNTAIKSTFDHCKFINSKDYIEPISLNDLPVDVTYRNNSPTAVSPCATNDE